jgi:uncharacterized membrane protein YiaA
MKRSIKIWTAIAFAALLFTYFLWFKTFGYRGFNGVFAIQILMLAGVLAIIYQRISKQGASNMRKKSHNKKTGKLPMIIGGLLGVAVWIGLYYLKSTG